jgi:hypothetical protein
MGKGNRHRGADRRRRDDRGEEKEQFHGQQSKSFGGRGQRFGSTIGGAPGQSERHSDPCFAAIKEVRNARSKIDAMEATLSANPDFVAYLKAKREMIEFEKKLGKTAEFSDYQKARRELRGAVSKLNEEKPKCVKCNFANAVKKEEQTTAPTEEATIPPVTPSATSSLVDGAAAPTA